MIGDNLLPISVRKQYQTRGRSITAKDYLPFMFAITICVSSPCLFAFDWWRFWQRLRHRRSGCVLINRRTAIGTLSKRRQVQQQTSARRSYASGRQSLPLNERRKSPFPVRRSRNGRSDVDIRHRPEDESGTRSETNARATPDTHGGRGGKAMRALRAVARDKRSAADDNKSL